MPFCSKEGKIYVYRKDKPDKLIFQSPSSIAYHKYYYSQPKADGSKENNKLEDLFSEIETKWSFIVNKLTNFEKINTNDMKMLFQFMGLQFARIPRYRDSIEKMLAESVRSQFKYMELTGKLLPKPKSIESINFNDIDILIDPHKSIHALPSAIETAGRVFDIMGFCVAHNKTDIPFLTSDNPVIWFDPSVPENEMRPYALSDRGPAILLFPISPTAMIYGHTNLRKHWEEHGFFHKELSEVNCINQMNLQICKFAYETIFSKNNIQNEIIRKHADISPILQSEVIQTPNGPMVIFKQIFGKRKLKQKWKK